MAECCSLLRSRVASFSATILGSSRVSRGLGMAVASGGYASAVGFLFHFGVGFDYVIDNGISDRHHDTCRFRTAVADLLLELADYRGPLQNMR